VCDTRCNMTGSDDVTSSDVSVSCCEVTTSVVTCAEPGLLMPSKIRGHYKSYTLQEKADILGVWQAPGAEGSGQGL